MPEETIFDLPRERLDLIDHDVYKWVCCAKDCNHYVRVRDYGEAPIYFCGRWKKSWFNVDVYHYLCGKHHPKSKKSVPFEYQNADFRSDLIFEKSICLGGTPIKE